MIKTNSIFSAKFNKAQKNSTAIIYIRKKKLSLYKTNKTPQKKKI